MIHQTHKDFGPIVTMTADEYEELTNKTKELKVDRFMTKEDFLESISKLLETYENAHLNQFTVGCEITIKGISYVWYNNSMEEMEPKT